MRMLPQSSVRWFYLAVRLAVGGTFIYAGALKITDALQFADNIASFRLLPNELINPFALSLPMFEIIAGALLVVGFLQRPASLGIAILSVILVGAVGSALARGLTIDCGCFGTSTPSRAMMWLDLWRDVALAVGALAIYRAQYRRGRESTGTILSAGAREPMTTQ